MKGVLLACVCCLLAGMASARERVYGFCEEGGQVMVVAGLNGTPDIQASFPSCTVNVFYTGLSGTLAITSIARSANVVTVTFSGSLALVTVNTTLVIAGVADSSYNGTFNPLLSVNSGTNTITYAQTGANSSSSGGSGKFTPNLFADNVGTVLANPFTAQASGLWFFYADNSRYDVQLSGAGFPSPFTFGDIEVLDPAASGAVGFSWSGITGFPAGCPATQFVTTIAVVPTCAQPQYSGIGGTFPGLTNFSYAQTGMDQLHLGTVATPTSTPLLTLTAQPTQPGFALMGPVPTPSGTNPSFETSVVNAATASTAITASGTPANAPTAAIFAAFCSDGTHPVAPTPGTWSTIDNSVNIVNGAIYASNLATGARISPSTACNTSSTWVDSIGFFGGSFSSVAHSSTLNTSCGTVCVNGTLGPLTAGNLILVVATWSSSTINISNPTVTDSAGNTYIKVASAYQSSAFGVGHFAFVAQFVGSGTPTITVNGNETSVGFGAVRAYELSGLTSFYAGPAGPWTFRQITQNDIAGTPLLWAGLLPGTNTSSGTFAQTGGTMDFSGSAAMKHPVATGAAPTADGAVATNSTTHTFNFGSNGTTVNVAAASTGAGGTGTTCGANQAITAISTTAAPTCTTTTATAVQLSSFTSLGGNVSVGNTATTITSLNITMPASGCPCRVRLDYGLYLDFPNTNVSAWAFWISDGTAGSTHITASLQTAQSNGATGARTSGNAGGYTQVTFANNANVTFTLFGQGTGATTMTVEAAPQTGSGTNSWMQAEILTSN